MKKFMSLAAATTTPLLAQPGAQQGGIMPMLLMIGAVFFLMYFLTIRPQQKRMKQQQEMQAGLKVNDVILTNTGMYGRIVSLNSEHVLTLEIAAGVNVNLARSQVFRVVDPQKEGVELHAPAAVPAKTGASKKPAAKKPAAKGKTTSTKKAAPKPKQEK